MRFEIGGPSGEGIVDDGIERQFGSVRPHRDDIVQRDLAFAVRIQSQLADFIARGEAVAADQLDQCGARIRRDGQSCTLQLALDQAFEIALIVGVAGDGRRRLRLLAEHAQRRVAPQLAGLDDDAGLAPDAPAPYIDEATRARLCEAALKIGRATNYVGAGTVEFLMDADTDAFYFIEVNPRIQVEHTVTEQVTGIDIVKAQIRIANGAAIGAADSGVPRQGDIRLNGHALQCRITTEDPEQNFIPDYGRITAYRGATGFGIRLDGGTAYSGAVITRFYDPLLEKVTAWAPTPQEAIARMNRALREFRIRGVATNLTFLENVINHPSFRDASYTTRFIDTTPELFASVRRREMRFTSGTSPSLDGTSLTCRPSPSGAAPTVEPEILTSSSAHSHCVSPTPKTCAGATRRAGRP